LGAVEVWGLERFDANWMVVKGQFKTRPLQQWSVTRAFNEQLKCKMDNAGIEIPIAQMEVHTLQKERSPAPRDVSVDQNRDLFDETIKSQP
jgi:small conductance mechanosensitive channel